MKVAFVVSAGKNSPGWLMELIVQILQELSSSLENACYLLTTPLLLLQFFSQVLSILSMDAMQQCVKYVSLARIIRNGIAVSLFSSRSSFVSLLFK